MNNNIVMIPSASLDHHPNNPRTDLGDLTELADSIRYDEGRNTEEPFMHELERRGIRKEAFALAWALCGGVSGDVYPDEGYISSYSAAYTQNDALDSQYSILTALGYEMSDFEKALQNGTHEFFTKKMEV